ncbi:putative cytochrome P450 304a1 isoform X2 [Lycorma delicatula]|uniref:putative cytochrome P450 304a1 isoform X2 n=1 Tax=Lycorma delicatula TaxID=130591 RepID=UPI003F51A7DD
MFSILMFLFFILLAVYIYMNILFKPKNFPPGPPSWPIWGGYYQILLENFRFPYKAIHEMAKRYNTNVVGTYLGSFATVIACDFESVRDVLLRPEFQGRVDAFVPRFRSDGDLLGIIFTEGDKWLEQRRFMLRNMRDFGFGRRSDVLEQPFSKNGYVKLPESFYAMYANMAVYIFSGDRKPFKEAYEFADNMVKQNKKIDTTTGVINMTPWMRYFAPGPIGYTVTKFATRYAKTFVQNLIDEHKSKITDDTTNDYIDKYMQEMRKQMELQYPTTYTEKQLQVTGMDMLFAGSTTVPFMTSFIIYLLSKHQRVQKKCQEEIEDVVGKSRLPTLNDRPNLPYTEAAIREALRFQTLVPLGVPHKATEDTTLGGYFIPKDTMVLTNLYSVHMDEKIWDNPQEYTPERFIEPNGKLKKRDLSLPFGLGKRVCAGETFARQNIFVVVSSLLQNFNFIEDPSHLFPELNDNIAGLNESPQPFWVKAEPRN